MSTPTTLTTSTREITLGPLTEAQRADIMRIAPTLHPEARQLFRRLLILRQHNGLSSATIARAAAQASAHFEA